jgi:hypothetical protein
MANPFVVAISSKGVATVTLGLPPGLTADDLEHLTTEGCFLQLLPRPRVHLKLRVRGIAHVVLRAPIEQGDTEVSIVRAQWMDPSHDRPMTFEVIHEGVSFRIGCDGWNHTDGCFRLHEPWPHDAPTLPTETVLRLVEDTPGGYIRETEVSGNLSMHCTAGGIVRAYVMLDEQVNQIEVDKTSYLFDHMHPSPATKNYQRCVMHWRAGRWRVALLGPKDHASPPVLQLHEGSLDAVGSRCRGSRGKLGTRAATTGLRPRNALPAVTKQ